MTIRMRSVLAATAVAALTAGGVLATTGTALAAGPAWEPDPNAQTPYGSVVFYDAAGNVLTGGTNLSHLADYVAGTTTGDSGANKATLLFALPDHTKATGAWFASSASASTNFPAATGPAQLQTSTDPVVTLGSSDANLSSFIGGTTADTSAGYADFYQVRVKDSGPGGVTSGTHYWATDIKLTRDASNAVTGWQVVYPAVTVTTTTISGPATNHNPTDGTSPAITLTSTTTGTPNGTAEFFDGATSLGTSPVSGGVATFTTTPATVASGGSPVVHSYTSKFVATGGTAFTGSSSSTPYTYTVNGPLTATSTALAHGASSGTTAFSSQVFTATVSPSAATGSVAFYDNGSSSPITGTVTNPSAGTYSLTTTALGQGNHSVVATFTGTGSYASSSSAPVAFSLAAPLCAGDPNAYPSGQSCSDGQEIQVTVTPGYLTISTPYTHAHPYVLPAMSLNGTGTLLSTSAPFPNVSQAGAGTDAPLTITSTLAGDPDWTASVTATDLTGTGVATPSGTNDSISAQNVGLTNWATISKSNPASVIAYTNNGAASGVQPGAVGTAGLKGTPKTFASTTGGGNGTLTAYGLLTITAPTNTVADTYTGTITFSVA